MNKIIILSLVLGCVYGGEVAYGGGRYDLQCAAARAAQAAAIAKHQAPVDPQVDVVATKVDMVRGGDAENMPVAENKAGVIGWLKSFFGGNKKSAVAAAGDNGAADNEVGDIQAPAVGLPADEYVTEGKVRQIIKGYFPHNLIWHGLKYGACEVARGAKYVGCEVARGAKYVGCGVASGASWVWGHRPSVGGCVKAVAYTVVGLHASSDMISHLSRNSPLVEAFVIENALYKIPQYADGLANMTVNAARTVCQLFGGCN